MNPTSPNNPKNQQPSQNLRIAAATTLSLTGAIQANLARTIHHTHKAKTAGATVVCFPELNITGYNPRDPRRTASLAQSIPGPVTDQLSNLAADTGLIILAGMTEHNPAGLPYATHCILHPDGRIDRYRKLHLAPPEKQCFQAGDTIPVFHAPTATFGIQLCYDAHFPELATAMTARGATILFMPHASPHGDPITKNRSWQRHLPARAFDNSIFIVACNQTGDNNSGLTFPGNALILGPDGHPMAQKETGEEGILIADLKTETLQAVRNHPMRHFFPNRRPELYTK